MQMKLPSWRWYRLMDARSHVPWLSDEQQTRPRWTNARIPWEYVCLSMHKLCLCKIEMIESSILFIGHNLGSQEYIYLVSFPHGSFPHLVDGFYSPRESWFRVAVPHLIASAPPPAQCAKKCVKNVQILPWEMCWKYAYHIDVFYVIHDNTQIAPMNQSFDTMAWLHLLLL